MENRTVKEMDRYLTPVDAWSMAFGCMIGWGVLVMPGTTFLPVAGPFGTLIAMGIGVIVMLILGAGISWMMNRSPRTGGLYSYTKEAFGRDHAFLCAWFLCLSYLTVVFLNGSALFLVVRILLGGSQFGTSYMIGGNQVYLKEIAVSAAALGLTGLLFIVAKPILQRLHTVLSLILAAGMFVTAVFCLPKAFAGGAVSSFGMTGVPPAFAVFSLVILAPWAFVGFEIISFDTAHFRFPVRKSKGIIVSAIILGGLAYAAMALVSISSVPDGYASWVEYFTAASSLEGVASVPTFYAARAIMGPVGLVILAITAVAAILTGIIGGYRAAMRVLSTMAEDRILSERFQKTSYSILFVMVLSILISLLGRNTLQLFVDLTAFGAIVAYGYNSAAVWKLARTENKRNYMAIGIIGTVIAASFAVVQLVPRLAAMEAMGAENFLLLSLWCLLGFVFYWRTIQRSPLTEYSGISLSGIALFSLLVYAALMWAAKTIAGKGSAEEMRSAVLRCGIMVLVIIFIGLAVMLYIQDLVRKKHEISEREKIRAVEGSLAKSRFLFNMSHDIRTPMNAVMGYTDLAMKASPPPEIRGYLTKIRTSGSQLLALINDILEMSRIESGKTELEYAPTDLGRLFVEIDDIFSEQMKQKGIEFSLYATQVPDPYVWCDRSNLNRILVNVTGNAFKFTPAGGSVSVSLLETGAENGYGSYEIRVRDTGIGMSREFTDRMFHSFERERTSTDSGVEGTGLGLAITKGLVDLMGGTIEVLTTPGSGTEIILRIKFRLAEKKDVLGDEEAAAGNDGAAEEDGSGLVGRRFLLAEDNAVNMEIAKAFLEMAGAAVETAENGQEALDMVASSQPGYYDAVLMDIQMPVMNGYDAAKAIRGLENEGLAEIPIIAMTANAFKEDEIASKEAGMQAHVAKPVDFGKLTETLRGVWRQE